MAVRETERTHETVLGGATSGRGLSDGRRLPAKLADRVDQWRLRALAALTGDYRFVSVHGFRLCGSVEHQLMLYWLSKGTYERYTRKLFQQALAPGMRVLDIGANLGYYSLLAAEAVGRTGRVYAFEPDPSNGRFLRHNVALNGHADVVTVVPKAVTGHSGTIRFFADGANSLKSSTVIVGQSGREIEVDATTIDEAVPAHEPVDVVKLDVEGAEIPALRGMERTLARSQKLVLFVECCPSALAAAGGSVAELLERLYRHGLQVDVINEKQKRLADGLDELFEAESARDERYYVNLYCRKGF